MPTTPWCHPSPAMTTQGRARPGSWPMRSTQASKISSSMAWRVRLSWHRYSARASARRGSSVSSSSRAASACSSRPAALIRGARVYPTVTAVTGLPWAPASRSRAASPGRLVRDRASSPRVTMVRFSPVRAITSATVPTAARSAYRAKTASRSAGGVRARISFRATPTPASSSKG